MLASGYIISILQWKVKSMPVFADFLVSLPAGTLILMSLLTLGTLLRRGSFFAPWMDAAALLLAALTVGILLRLIRPRRASLTALLSGGVAAGLLLTLRFSAAPGDVYNPLVFGFLGAGLAWLFTLLGAQISLRKQSSQE